MNFDTWYNTAFDEDGWWKDKKAPLRHIWKWLRERDISETALVSIFSTIVNAVKDQYGE